MNSQGNRLRRKNELFARKLIFFTDLGNRLRRNNKIIGRRRIFYAKNKKPITQGGNDLAYILTIGEPLVLFSAEGDSEKDKPLKDICCFKKFVAGAELNLCIGLTRLGHKTQYITQVGKDPFGEFIAESIENEGVGNDYIHFSDDYFTGFQLKSKVTVGDPDIFYFRRNSAASHFNHCSIDRIPFENVDAVHLTGIFPALSHETKRSIFKILTKAKEKNIPVFFDPNLRPQLWASENQMIHTINEIAAQSTIVMPGISEAIILTGYSDPEQIADFYLNQGVETVIIKQGGKGAFFKSKDEKGLVEGFKPKKIVDTVGAGDGFAAGVISGLLEHLNMREAIRRGNAIGCLAIQAQGDNEGYPTRDELEKFYEGNRVQGEKS